jgi:hypothetical protein
MHNNYVMPKFCTVVLFVIIDLQMTFHAQFVCVFVINLFTKFHMPNSSGSLVIAVKLKAKENFFMATTLLLL